MKKITILFVLALASLPALGQLVPNGDFEQLNADGSLRHWGNVYQFSVWIDSNGVGHSDSIAYDEGYFYQPSTVAHAGNRALELRNAWNVTRNEGIAGAAACDEDSVFTSWGSLGLIPTNGSMANPFMPSAFEFWYQFSPVNGDSAFAQVVLWDSAGNQMGEGTLILTMPTQNYTLGSAAIAYSQTGNAAFYSIFISNFYTVEPGSHEPAFGTRLLVDDFSFEPLFTSLVNPNSIGLSVFPNPATGETLLHCEFSGEVRYRLMDAQGKAVATGSMNSELQVLSLAGLSRGIYLLEAVAGEQSEYLRLVLE